MSSSMASSQPQTKIFVSAAESGDVLAISRLLSDNFNVNKEITTTLTDDRNIQISWPPIVLAAHYGHKDVTAFLLDSGANIDDCTSECGADSNVALPAKPRSSTSSRLLAGESALYRAAAQGNLEVVQLLVKRGASPSCIVDRERTTALVSAADNNPSTFTRRHERVVNFLLGSQGYGLDAEQDGGFRILAAAAQHDNLDFFRALVSAGADVNARGLDTNRRSIVEYVTLLGREEMLWTLLDQGADIPNENNEYVASHIAAAANNVPILETLLEYGADMEVQKKDGEKTALDAAMAAHAQDAIGLLVEHGFVVHASYS